MKTVFNSNSTLEKLTCVRGLVGDPTSIRDMVKL